MMVVRVMMGMDVIMIMRVRMVVIMGMDVVMIM